MVLADEKANEAYCAWELKEYEIAIEAFLEAANLERDEAMQRSKWAAPDGSFLYELRAGFCMWEMGKIESAKPFLEKVRGFDWKGNRLWGDRWDSDTAYTYLLLPLATAQNKKMFNELFLEACENGEKIQLPFSSVIPNQKKLIWACLDLKERGCIKKIIDNVRNESLQKDQELKLSYSQAQKFLKKRFLFFG
jgi:tetratricopeptide (TPR) repeat protein